MVSNTKGKRITAVLIALIMVLSMLPEAILAEGEEIPLPTLAQLYITSKGRQALPEDGFTLTPSFSPEVREYTVIFPDNDGGPKYLYLTKGEDVPEGMNVYIENTYWTTGEPWKQKASDTESKKGTRLYDLVTADSADPKENTIYVKIGADQESAVTVYTIHVKRYATLTGLNIQDNDGNELVLEPAFAAGTTEYVVNTPIPDGISLNVTATKYCSDAQNVVLAVDGTGTASGTAATVTPSWDGDGKYVMNVTVGGGTAQTTTYTVAFEKENSNPAKSLRIISAPDKTVYKKGDVFDPTGLRVSVVYMDDTESEIDNTLLSFIPSGALDITDDHITVKYGSISVDVPITVGEVLAGTGTETDPYIIASIDDLIAIRENVASGSTYSGKYFKIINDIELPSDWVPIGSLKPGRTSTGNGMYVNPFSGNINGDGHTITVAEGGRPLFKYVREASVENLNIYGKYIPSSGLVESYTVDWGTDGQSSTGIPPTINLTNVVIKSGTNICGSGFLGGYASAGNHANFTNCTVEAGVRIGVNADGSPAGLSDVGSFAGASNGTITNCVSYADVYGVDNVGGIAGSRGQSTNTYEIIGCEFHGTVNATGNNAGGILGSGYYHYTAPNAFGVVIENCTVDGTVTGVKNVGGIFGAEAGIDQLWDNGPESIKNNSFTGTVSGTENVGAIIGYVRALNINSYIENNYFKSGCGADKGIAKVTTVDTSGVEYGMHDGVFYFNTATAYTDEQWAEIYAVNDADWAGTGRNTGHSFEASQGGKKYNRSDDPLGADKDNLCYTDAVPEARAISLEVSGTYKTEYTVGDRLDMTGMVFTVGWNDGTTTNPDSSEITVEGFDTSNPGEKTLTLRYKTTSTTVRINVKPKKDTITVTVSVYGDIVHNSDSDKNVHGLAMGGLNTWVAPTQYETTTDKTVWDVLQVCFAENGITPIYNSNSGTVYVAGLIRGGVELSEFTNGVNSGWQYTLNGTHPLLGVAQQYLTNGDVIVFHYTDDYTKEEGSQGYNDDDLTAIENVEKLIDAIGSPVTLESEAKIRAAREAYDNLNYQQKSKVSNYDKLTKAEEDLKKLQDAEDKKKAQEVVTLIKKIKQPVTLQSEAEIRAAREAYDELTEAQKELVTNYQDLLDREYDYALLIASEEDKQKAADTEKLIEAITFPVTLQSREAIEKARAAYDALTDTQKMLVKNYMLLEKAEKDLAVLTGKQGLYDMYEKTGDYLESLGTPESGSVGGEWMAIGLVRSGRDVDAEGYYQTAVDYVNENINEKEQIHWAKSSENSRLILGLTALGYDVTDVDGHDLLYGLTDMDYVKNQGINGPVWALIAMDSNNYELPDNPSVADYTTREKLVDYILSQQLPDGGWALSGEVSDSDITGMTLTALAPYYDSDPEVRKAVDTAIETLSRMQNADGSFSAFGGDGGLVPTSESMAQVIVALSSLGIDCDTDPRFIKNGKSLLDAFMEYYVDGSGFRHILGYDVDGMATEQAYYAMTAYVRMREGKTPLYDMTDLGLVNGDTPLAAQAAAKKSISPLWGIPVLAAAGAGAYFFIKRRREDEDAA